MDKDTLNNTPPPNTPAPVVTSHHITGARKRLSRLQTIVIADLVVVAIVAGAWLYFSSTDRTTDSTQMTNAPQQLAEVNFTSLAEAYDTYSRSGIVEFSSDKKQATLDAYRDPSQGFIFNLTFPDTKANTLASLSIARLSLDSKTR